jgi:glycosyltransferase involved in cell wall biosynthesis
VAKSRLLIINYSMDPNDPIFAHQFEIVCRLSAFYENISVITGRSGKCNLPKNVKVVTSGWIQGKPFSSLIIFLYTFLNEIKLFKPDVVFSHMTDVHSSFIGPITYFKRIPHYLWYAHAKKSVYLLWSSIWVNRIISSTEGSCPIRSSKRSLIGQSIDHNIFKNPKRTNLSRIKFIHVGRLDPSKNILEIIDAVNSEKLIDQRISLCLIGSPSSPKETDYLFRINELVRKNKAHWISMLPRVSRDKLPEKLIEFDCFIHAYRGSLDKVLIEATMCEIPVVTVNQEFITEFGSWSGLDNPSLSDELDAFLRSPQNFVASKVDEIREVAVAKHSMDGWLIRLVKILDGNV